MMSETSKFTDDILTAAKKKAETIVKEAETDRRKALDQAKADSTREAEDIVRNAQAEAESIKRRQISEVRRRLKLQEQVEKNKILTDVLDQTKARVLEITRQDEEYYSYLAELVRSAIREIGLDRTVVHLNSNDLNRIDKAKLEREIAKKLDKPARIEWANEPIQALGGAVVSSTDGRARIVNTLDQRLEALEPKLLIEAGKTLFGE
jgi:vacuolar-type H+-ATPase subunit E/Vma4